MVAETVLTPADFIAPLFVIEGTSAREEISSMPGYYRMSLDLLKKEVKDYFIKHPKENFDTFLEEPSTERVSE